MKTNSSLHQNRPHRNHETLFHANNPYPLLQAHSHTYTQAQDHARAADTWLGLRINEIEHLLATSGSCHRAANSSHEKQELWFGLEPQNLLTPYTEIRMTLDYLKLRSNETVIDLGAGYGRMGFVMGHDYPENNFIGYEYVGERVLEARRCLAHHHYPRIKMEHTDISAKNFQPALAKYYFIYDFGTPKAIEKILHDLRRVAEKNPIVVVARGRLCNEAIQWRHPWLKQDTQFSDISGKGSVYNCDTTGGPPSLPDYR